MRASDVGPAGADDRDHDRGRALRPLPPDRDGGARDPGELEGAEEELRAARAETRVQRHHGRATGTVTDAEDAQRELDRLPVVKAAGIGLGQALALIPGTSRSGSSWTSSPRPPRPRPSWSPAPSPPPSPASWPCRF